MLKNGSFPSASGAFTSVPAVLRGEMSNSESLSRIRAAALRGARDLGRENAASREASVRKDLTHRLKCVCNHMSSVEFDDLVGDMAREQLRGEGIPGRRIRH